MSESISTVTTEALIQFGGRLHPLVLHLPIGLFAALVFFELLALVKKKPLDPALRSALAWITAIASIVATGSGLLLSREDAYSGDTLDNHKLLGIAVAALALLAAMCSHRRSLRVAYGLLIVVTGGILIPAGHLGATMTHGPDFLTAPFAATRPAPTPTAARETVRKDIYASEIAPIFADKCYSCHGPSKHKGGLALHTREKIELGGDFGPVLIPGDAAASELVRRMRLPFDDEDRMPPKSKAQPTEAEIVAIERWITDGASFSESEGDGAGNAVSTPAFAPVETKITLPPPEAMAALLGAQVHAEYIEPGEGLLWVDFAGASPTDDAQARALLAPLKDFIADLSLTKTATGDGVLSLIAEMPNLRSLDLSGTNCTSAGLRVLGDLEHLEELRLTRTKLDDTAVDSLAEMPALKRLYLWNSGISPKAASNLHTVNGGLLVDVGTPAGAEPVETEAAVKLSGEAPLPGAASTQVSLAPVNTKCPVSGAPVSPKYAIVHEGKVIGFCCEVCAGKFWAEPGKYPLDK